MRKSMQFKTLEESLLLLQTEAKSKNLSLAEVLHILSDKGRPLLLILLTLPFCFPIQIPGFSTPFGILIALVGLRMVFGSHIWLPKKLLSRNISSSVLEKITQKTLAFVKKVKPWIHPRLDFLCHFSFFEKGNGILIFILGILLSLPLPIPFSNLAVAWPILFIGFGTLEDDGVFILVGYLLSLIAIGFFVALGLTVKTLF